MTSTGGVTRVHAIGSQAATALRQRRSTWSVLASFPQAVYLTNACDIVVLTTLDVPVGPIHLTTEAGRLEAEAGATAVVTGHTIRLGRQAISFADAAEWTGRLPPPHRLVASRDALAIALALGARASALASGPFAARAAAGLAAARRLDLQAAAGELLGLGPGLTPAGDDALAGFLVVAIAMGALSPQSWTLGSDAEHMTNQISLSYVRLAAAGQAIAPVHDVLAAGSSRHRAARESACDRLSATGGTSGADIMFGMEAALRTLA